MLCTTKYVPGKEYVYQYACHVWGFAPEPARKLMPNACFVNVGKRCKTSKWQTKNFIIQQPHEYHNVGLMEVLEGA